MRWLVADWNENKGHVFANVLRALDALGHTAHRVPRSDMSRRQELASAIRSGEFDAVLTWQRFYRMQKDLLSAVAESGIRTVFMDFGFTPHYKTVVFDTLGENAASSWPGFWRNGGPKDLTQVDLDAADTLMCAESARARLLVRPDQRVLDHLRLPFIFVPLQRPGDAVIKHDSRVHDFGQLLRRVLLLAHGRLFVVCKTHPLDRDLDLGVPDRIEGGHLILRESFGGDNEHLCDYLLSRAALVIGINSNMLFRALLFGTPVLATGRGWYSGSGALCEVDGVADLHTLSVPFCDVEAQRRYIATCLARQLSFDELQDPERLSAVLNRIGLPTASRNLCA